MNEFGQQITFGQLLAHHGRVQVPIIQRDYAQGRVSEQEVREQFLYALYQALTLPPDGPSLPLNLDFIYGSVEGDQETRFQPLDGQQRLTTLFLLHWYLAWHDDSSEKHSELLCVDGNSRFSYTVRPSSTEFYDALVQYWPDRAAESVNSVSHLLVNQSWYFRYWRLDPTIQSSLIVLDAIHRRFRDTSGLYTRITDTERPAITFQLLDLDNFGLSDDLYIKMNARGKPLTEFETFKARYEYDLKEKFNTVSLTFEGECISAAEFFARRIDTTWADFFWSHRNTKTNLYDQVVMNLLRIIVLCSRDPNTDIYLDDVSQLRSHRIRSSYLTFQDRGWLDDDFRKLLFRFLETLTLGRSTFEPLLPDKCYFDETAILKKALNEPTDLIFTELIQLTGYVLYVGEHYDAISSDQFQEWLRIIFNLSTNTAYDRPSDMQRSIAAIINLLPHSTDILTYFRDNEQPTVGFSQQQVSEEKLKAQLILAEPKWREAIDQAEAHPYFKGQIEFLFIFCGVIAQLKTDEMGTWTPDIHETLRKQFSRYLTLGESMFGSHGLIDLGEYRWQRALLSIGDYLLPSGRQNISFLSNSITEQGSWKRLLRGTGQRVAEARRALHQLFERLDPNQSLALQLDEIIDTATEIDRWRRACIETPEAFSYCKRHAIRFNSKNEIYLLSKSQMNGSHVELFTYWLFHKKLLPAAKSHEFSPLKLVETYDSVIGGDVEPGIRVLWSGDDQQLTFFIEWKTPDFIVFLQKDQIEPFPDVVGALCNEAGFAEIGEIVMKKMSWEDFPSELRGLANILSAHSEASSTMDI